MSNKACNFTKINVILMVQGSYPMWTKMYKIVQKDGDNIKFLFHGINGTRTIPLNKCIKADIKHNVRDGVGNSYTSGIHVIDGLEEAKNYLSRFRRKDRIIVECFAFTQGLQRKEKSKSAVYLANEIFIETNKPVI